ncbi:class I SAM-dependent methyltransferase [Chryseolinea lacunae]|uniref:Class I SAM-dependent methyltransferase n=1 Tax=Chryseolinea lacunae TaxID=2801331 RepID=A0ABS1KL72_9BACT|nr:class I SAM-dependent methyltransferase [Chryseolinea lacunae]MBL0740205.1 class I SAM-dependent methyltransferase [Chryseolinea lacunae]
MKLLHPASWQDYELLDSGNFEKLERFGKFVLIRPEPQALWSKSLDEDVWKKTAHAKFVREQTDKFRFTDDVKGGWSKQPSMPESWNVQYNYNGLRLTLRLALTGFGHVGIFPEQGSNWNFIYDTLSGWALQKPKVLNLFAYTGAASVVAKSVGADVTHCDASRPGLNWASQNMQQNNLQDIRWVYEDAFKFVKREVKRGNKYHGLIMDPPPYGRGPEGEKWTLQEQLDELLHMASALLEKKNHFFILSMYAAGLSPLVGLNVARTHFDMKEPEYGEFFLKSAQGKDLPMGTFLRFRE